MEFYGEEGSAAELKGTTLVVPAISIGNVGQLAIDLIITGLDLKRIGFLEEPNVLPCAGNDAVGLTSEGIMSTSLEVFQSSSGSITIVQQRAPYAPGRLKAYAQNLSEWVKRSGFQKVVVLSGLDAGKQLAGHSLPQQRVRYTAATAAVSQDERATSAETGPGSVGLERKCEELGWPILEDLAPSEGPNGHGQEETSSSNGTSYGSMFGIEGSGATGLERGQWWGPGKAYQRTAFWKMSEALKEQGVSVLSLLLLCSEGDNVPDGLALATALDSLLGLRGDQKPGNGPSGWDIPSSWASIYGPPPDTSLFG
ncbi:hypothetical protein KFL_000060740 [Klebsormidium nitens]|uniref:Proteasome assembly chaperone 2 n=1 Tax=Klebsormidium nitens TaxID=105231 RepID=A0A0U9HJX0_KLENI|nr:hypothetical protein KFL_000060740 [Klebsormidium nitens]|eukprot:GAQ78007.1 hypothetical protein KFL_000060740 [Klebsormidium nitens]